MGRTIAPIKGVIAFSFHEGGYGMQKYWLPNYLLGTLTTMSMSSTKYLFNICFDIKSRAPLSTCWSVQIELHTKLINKTATGINVIWNNIKNYGFFEFKP